MWTRPCVSPALKLNANQPSRIQPGKIDRGRDRERIAGVAALHGVFDVPVEHVELVAVHHPAVPAGAVGDHVGVGEVDRSVAAEVLADEYVAADRSPLVEVPIVGRAEEVAVRGRAGTGAVEGEAATQAVLFGDLVVEDVQVVVAVLPHATEAVERQSAVVVVVAHEELGSVGVLLATEADAEIRSADLPDVDPALIKLHALRGVLVGGVDLADRGGGMKNGLSFEGLNSSPKWPVYWRSTCAVTFFAKLPVIPTMTR